MASSWRDNREKYGAGGYVQGLLEGNKRLLYLAELNPPVFVLGTGPYTHLAVGDTVTEFRRVYAGNLAPLGGNAIFQWGASFVRPLTARFPFGFSVLPDPI